LKMSRDFDLSNWWEKFCQLWRLIVVLELIE
jgi:hypothetical protein